MRQSNRLKRLTQNILVYLATDLNRRRTGIGIFLILLIGIFVWVRIESSHIGSNTREGEELDDSYVSGTVFIDGEEYVPKKNIKSFLVIGVDKKGQFKDSGTFENDELCDFLALIVFDSDAKTYKVIHINRDTMTPVKKLGERGETVSTRVMQIALAHTYGNGLEKSCDNTVDAVSNLLYGVNIDRYYAITMSAVAGAADYVGGVPVTITEDMTAVNEKFTEGAEIVLKGDDALDYVRARGGVGDQTNLSRMDRQKRFVSSLMDVIEAEELTDEYVAGLFKKIGNYSLTDITANELPDLAEWLEEYSYGGIVSPEGEAVYDGSHICFYVEDETLKDLVTDYFYNKVEEKQ